MAIRVLSLLGFALFVYSAAAAELQLTKDQPKSVDSVPARVVGGKPAPAKPLVGNSPRFLTSQSGVLQLHPFLDEEEPKLLVPRYGERVHRNHSDGLLRFSTAHVSTPTW